MSKRAFILGSSGELLDHDLSLLKGETVFGVNALPLRIPEIITHYVCIDIIMAFAPEIRALVPKTAKKYYSTLVWNTIYEEEGVHPVDIISDDHIGFEFSTDRVYSGRTCTYVALQIAAALGYDEIYLLGIDLGLPENGIMHIPEQQKMRELIWAKNLRHPMVDKRATPDKIDSNLKFYQRAFLIARDAMKKRGIKVVNLSKGGNLNCFPRESYEELLAKKEEVNVF